MSERTPPQERMTAQERRDLLQLTKNRAKVAKLAVDQIAAERLAEFEQQAASEYHADDDPIWADQARMVKEVVAEANKHIAQRCLGLRVPDWTAPRINATWYDRETLARNELQSCGWSLKPASTPMLNAPWLKLKRLASKRKPTGRRGAHHSHGSTVPEFDAHPGGADAVLYRRRDRVVEHIGTKTN